MEIYPIGSRERPAGLFRMGQLLGAAAAMLVLSLVALCGPRQAAYAQQREPAPCQLMPAFDALRNLITPQRVGACTEGGHETGSGDTEQRTTNGLLVWRRLDDLAAFTDGTRAWLIGPAGLVWQRPNGDRFDWEPESVPASPASGVSAPIRTGWQPATPDPCLPAVKGWERTAGGVAAQVSNPCGTERVFGLGAVLYDAEGGRPVSATGEAVWRAPAGESRSVFLPGRTVGATHAALLPTAAPPDERLPGLCLDVGASRCLVTDAWLYGTVRALEGTEAGPPLLRAAAEGYVELRWGAAPFDSIGFYDFDARAVTLDWVRLAAAGDWERAAVLAHELQHAADYAAGRSFARGAECLAREVDATLVQGHVWLQLWQGRLPVATTAYQGELNGIALGASLDRQRFTRKLASQYQPQCGTVW